MCNFMKLEGLIRATLIFESIICNLVNMRVSCVMMNIIKVEV